MEISFDIVDKIYHDIDFFCSSNNLTIEEYAKNCLLDTFYTTVYGDLNAKVNGSKTISDSVEVKTDEEIKTSLINDNNTSVGNDSDIVSDEKIEDTQTEPIVDVIKQRKKRTLKTK